MLFAIVIVFIFIHEANAVNLVVFKSNFNIKDIYYSKFFDDSSNHKMLREGHLIANASYEYFTKMNINNKYYTKWNEWSECYECGQVSLRNRTGRCYQKPFYSEDKQFERSCVKNPGETSIVFENLTQYENCFVNCTDSLEYNEVK